MPCPLYVSVILYYSHGEMNGILSGLSEIASTPLSRDQARFFREFGWRMLNAMYGSTTAGEFILAVEILEDGIEKGNQELITWGRQDMNALFAHINEFEKSERAEHEKVTERTEQPMKLAKRKYQKKGSDG